MTQQTAECLITLNGRVGEMMSLIDGLVQDWSNSIANTLELLQSCT